MQKQESEQNTKTSFGEKKARVLKSLEIFNYLKPHKWYFFFGMISLLFSSMTVMVMPKSLGVLIDVSMGNRNLLLENRTEAAFLLVVVVVFQGLFSFLRIWFFAKVNEPAMAAIRNDLYKKIICMPVSFFDENRIGELTSRITTDVASLQDTLSLTLAEFFRQISILIIGIAFLFYTSAHLTLVMLSSFPVVIVLAIFFGRFIQKNSKETQDALAQANIVVEETFQSVNMVKAYTNERYESRRYGKDIHRTLELALKGATYRGAFITFIIVALIGSFIFVLWTGTGLVEQNHIDPNTGITTGTLIEFLMYTLFIGGSIGGLSETYGRLQRAVGASERILAILNTPGESDTMDYAPLRLNGYIRYEDIHFSYPSRNDIAIFKGLSFEIMPGQKVALVGPSGAGKSTIVQLLLKFYLPDSGHILVDNVPIDTMSVKELRGNMAIVPQEVLLFGGTIRENILYGKLDATEADVMQAAVKANAWEFISRFPQGLDTIVGERGIKLSGGQRQRIAIARAILKDPSILLLDEATSALDAESEKLVQAALNTLMEGRTTIIIAHRLSTVRNVDKILVLNHGVIVEQGTHDELSSMENGLYNNLLKLQYQLH